MTTCFSSIFILKDVLRFEFEAYSKVLKSLHTLFKYLINTDISKSNVYENQHRN
jgi:hypothetical protein